MATNFDETVREAAAQVRRYVENAAQMEVRTYYVVTGSADMTALERERPGAVTVFNLDGDTKVVVPMRKGRDETLELDEALFNIHERNVAMATAYRAQVLNALIGLLQRR
ncbi:MAG: hypothetical protein AB4911_14060 [Oscillochloridaceae bacterium umkhey_bin13]